MSPNLRSAGGKPRLNRNLFSAAGSTGTDPPLKRGTTRVGILAGVGGDGAGTVVAVDRDELARPVTVARPMRRRTTAAAPAPADPLAPEVDDSRSPLTDQSVAALQHGGRSRTAPGWPIAPLES